MPGAGAGAARGSNVNPSSNPSLPAPEIRGVSESEFYAFRQDFREHEEQDESRHIATTGRLTALEIGQADLKGYIRGRSAVLGVVLLLGIPLLTEAAHAWFSQRSAEPAVTQSGSIERHSR